MFESKKFNIPSRPDDSELSRLCAHCKSPFVSRESGKLYCSSRCSHAARGLRKQNRSKQSVRQQPRVVYHEYIKSPAWKKRAAAAKERAGNRCQVCNRTSGIVRLEAHHRTYARLGHELPDDITVLCEDCHDLFSKNGRLAKYS